MATCGRSGLLFEASSKRQKNHPQISEWLQQANKEGWYRECVVAIENGKKRGFTTLEEFEEIITTAKNRGLEAKEKSLTEYRQKKEEFKLESKRKAYTNKLLAEHGYSWHRSDVLDIAQGEIGQSEFTLMCGDRIVELEDALNEIASTSTAIATGLKNLGIIQDRPLNPKKLEFDNKAFASGQTVARLWVSENYGIEINNLCSFATIQNNQIIVRVRQHDPAKEWGVNYNHEDRSCSISYIHGDGQN